MPEMTDKADRVVDAALGLAATEGWRRVTVADIAAAGGMPLGDVYDVLDRPGAVWRLLIARVDRRVLAEAEPGAAEESKRDLLFDLLMRRFEALAPHRQAVESMLRALPSRPLGALCSGARLLRSMQWMLEAARIPAAGPIGAIRCKALLAVYLATLRVWLDDDTPDLARTMAALDRRLSRAERLLGAF